MKAVWIIGAGVAGLSAALTLARHGQESVLVSSAPSVRAQSVMAEEASMRRWIPKGKATAWKSISGIPWKPGVALPIPMRCGR